MPLHMVGGPPGFGHCTEVVEGAAVYGGCRVHYGRSLTAHVFARSCKHRGSSQAVLT